MEVKPGYLCPPGYKQTEVGVIPESWQTPRVGDICGCIVPGRNKPKYFGGDIPWITTPDLENGKPVTTSRLGLCISRAEAKAVGSKVVPPGSVLMSCAGELGIVALTQNEIVVNQQLHVFIPTDRIDGRFLLSALAYRKDRIANYGTKTAVPYLNKNACNSILVPLPPLPEQHAIAEDLSDMDELIGAMDQLIAKKRDLKQATMRQLLTGQTRLPGFSGEWEVKRLGEVCRITTGKKDVNEGNPSGQYPFFTCARTNTFSDSFSFEGEAILIAGNGEVGNLNYCNGRFEAYQRTYVLLGFTANVSYLWHQLAAYLASSLGIGKVGSSIPYIKMGDLFRFEFRSPRDVNEQTAIAEVLSDMDAELVALEQRRDKTNALKQGMMQELLTGRTRLV